MEPVVHTSFPSFSTFLAPYKLPLFHSQYSLQRQGSNHILAPPLSSSSSSSLSAALTMEIIKSRERRQVSIEKVRRYSTVEVEDEEEEEDESVAGLAEDERKKGGGRRGAWSSAGGGGVSLPSCQAEMCGADLTVAKRYHRRHKVCELHSKAPSVMIAGLRQRFCQQCSRFHELAEFDEAKRSCRRRLARHNERRRKSNVETCNSNASKEQQHPAESHCRNADDWGRIQMSIAKNSAYKPFHIT